MRNPDKMFQKLSNPDATTAAMWKFSDIATDIIP
jgi:hypothetical protein